MAREHKVVENAAIKHSMHVRDVETRSTRPQIVPTLIKRAEKAERSVIWQGHGKQSKGGKGTSSPKTCWNCGESGHVSSQCPKKKVHAVDESAATVSVAGSQETVMVGAIGSYFDLGSVSEWRIELRGEELSTQDLSRCGWETVFLAGCGDAQLIRKASNTRITLVKKRCAWYLRAKLKPHHALLFTKGKEFLEVMSLDHGAGVWPVFEGGSSSSSGPMVPEDVEESTPVEKLVTPSAPTAEDREEHTANGHPVFRTWCRECCIGRGRNAPTSCRRKGNCDTSDCH